MGREGSRRGVWRWWWGREEPGTKKSGSLRDMNGMRLREGGRAESGVVERQGRGARVYVPRGVLRLKQARGQVRGPGGGGGGRITTDARRVDLREGNGDAAAWAAHGARCRPIILGFGIPAARRSVARAWAGPPAAVSRDNQRPAALAFCARQTAACCCRCCCCAVYNRLRRACARPSPAAAVILAFAATAAWDGHGQQCSGASASLGHLHLVTERGSVRAPTSTVGEPHLTSSSAGDDDVDDCYDTGPKQPARHCAAACHASPHGWPGCVFICPRTLRAAPPLASPLCTASLTATK